MLGDVEIWVGDHAAASDAGRPADSTGGAIVSTAARHDVVVPGTATPRATVRLTGPVHEITADDARLVTVTHEEVDA